MSINKNIEIILLYTSLYDLKKLWHVSNHALCHSYAINGHVATLIEILCDTTFTLLKCLLGPVLEHYLKMYEFILKIKYKWNSK